MTVRGRVTASMVAIALPAVVLAVTLSWRARRDAQIEALAAAVVARMEAVGRARCETEPTRFGLGPWGRRGRHRGPLAGPGPLAAARVTAYDASLRPASRRAPPLGEDVRAELEEDGVALVSGFGEGAALAVRMPWSDGPCAVVVVEPRDPRWQSADAGLWREVGFAVLVIALALGVALVALGPPLGRLRRLSEEVRRAADEGYGRPTTVGGTDEIGEVARAFDAAARRVRQDVDRIEARDRALTEYVDATTHDLAIPLTVLQGRLSEAEAQLATSGQVERAVLEGALAETQFLSQLVGNMSAAARLENGAPDLERRPVDLVALVERVAARHAPVARHHRLSLEYAVPDGPVTVLGDDILLERAVSNLVHNAIRHRTPPAGSVETGRVALLLETERDESEGGGAHFRITVMDDGAGVDEALIEGLARGDGTARRPPAGGSRGRGLGLQIVRAVAAAHDMALRFERGTEGGLQASLQGQCQGLPGAS